MGVNYLCCLIQSSPERRRRGKSSRSTVQHVGSTSSTIDVSEPATCSKRDQSQSDSSKKKMEVETEMEGEMEMKMEMGEKSSSTTLTLREIMLASPIKDQSPDHCVTSSDLQIIKQLPNKIYVTNFPEPPKEFFTPSPSSPRQGRLLKIDEEYEEEVFSVSPVMRTSPSTTTDKGKRRVTFRSPKESDVVVVYSPAMTPEE